MRAGSSSYRVLYNFPGFSGDAVGPRASLVAVKDALYGTTYSGGAGSRGTVFMITTAGKEKLVHSFGGSDGANPWAGLIEVKGMLYGTTQNGGAPNACSEYYGCGTVFSINPKTGAENVLYSFAGGSADGEFPQAGLVYDKATGLLYGTTAQGGAYCEASGGTGCGTVFSVGRNGKGEKLLHSFEGVPTDGTTPVAGLIDVKGTLYGTTEFGGVNAPNNGFGGTVFSISNAGENYDVLFTFDGSDGIGIDGGVIDEHGKLYGTANAYGIYDSNGTVFAINTSGKETMLFGFNGSDGAGPQAGLIYDKTTGLLYGTTSGGGSGSYPSGTLFSISTRGTETVLHSFGVGSYYEDGHYPVAGLTDLKGTLYGTTEFGGANRGGVVYALTP